MKTFSIVILLSVGLLSCFTKKEREKEICWITIDSLFKKTDTSKFEFSFDTSKKLYEILEKPAITGERGLFKFDTLGHLRLYSFLHDKEFSTNFYIEYDSLGQKKRVQYYGGDVLQWNFKWPKPDSIIRLSFLLCELDCHYETINIEAGSFKKNNLKPFNTNFVKVVGISLEFPSSMLDNTRKISLLGKRRDNCTGNEIYFKDTITAP